jgi:tripartite-type tricarboxylate transporter receptor subunit TctC
MEFRIADTFTDSLARLTADEQKDPELRKRFAELAVIPAGTSPADTAKFLADEVEKWRNVITTAGVKIDA